MALVSLQDIHLALGGPALLDGVRLQIERGERQLNVRPRKTLGWDTPAEYHLLQTALTIKHVLGPWIKER